MAPKDKDLEPTIADEDDDSGAPQLGSDGGSMPRAWPDRCFARWLEARWLRDDARTCAMA